MNIDNLKGLVPDTVLAQLPDVIQKFNFNTPERLAHFLAQCAHESGGFNVVRENLNYSAKGLKTVFPKYFPNNLNESYARQPEKIASRVYGGRMGNGDEASQDGWKFRGRGYIQLTGKENYTSFSKDVGIDCVSDPDKVATTYPLLSAGWFFNKNKLNAISDLGATDEVVKKVTLRVNGGINGLAERTEFFHKFYNRLTS